MNDRVYYFAGGSEALNYAAGDLAMHGLNVADTPCEDVTHLVLGVPCRMSSGELKQLLSRLPRDIKVLGGYLDREELQGYCCIDLLKDESYLAANAAITAHCALRVASELLNVTIDQCPVLILGWGRIGKCLAQLLRGMGADVVVAVRKESQRAILTAMGYEAERFPITPYILPRFRVIFNTVDAPVLSAEALRRCRPGCLKIELASTDGMAGAGIIKARGLPGTMVPESSGKLIARSVLRLCAQKEASL